MASIDTALEWHYQDLRVIPLGAYNERPPDYFIAENDGDVMLAVSKWPKVPRVAKWRQYQEATPTEKEVEQWWQQWPRANIGLLTGSEINVVDADSEAMVAWVRANLTPTPWTVKTGNGRHFYYRAGAIEVRNSASKGLDTRGVGGYVVGPGSTHPSGTVYALDKDAGVSCDSYVDLPELSTDDLAAVKEQQRFLKHGKAEALPGGQIIDLAQYLGAPGAATDEGGRNVELARYAGLCIQQGQSLAETLNSVTVWNESNNPPLPISEILKTVHSVVRVHKENTGQDVPAQRVVPATIAAELVFTLRELTEDPPAPVVPLWGDRLIFEGARVLIAGEPKIGKSRFALALQAAASVGGHFLIETFTKPVKCLWLQAELHKSFLPERVRAVTRGYSADQMAMMQDNLVMSGRLDLDIMDDGDYAQIRALLDKYQPDLLLIDPVIDFSSAEENSNTEVRKLLRRVNALQVRIVDGVERRDLTIAIVHHVSKPAKGQAANIRGAGAFRGWYDTGIKLSDSANNTLIEIEARNGKSPGAFTAQWDEGAGRYGCEMIEAREVVEDRQSVAGMMYGDAYQIIDAMEGERVEMQVAVTAIMRELRIDNMQALKVIAEVVMKTRATRINEAGGACYISIAPYQKGDSLIKAAGS